MVPLGNLETPMFFVLKVASCLAIVFLMLPDDDANRVTGEVTRAITQDKTVQAVIERTNLAAQHATADVQKLCLKNTDECVGTALQIVKGAASRW
jgi:hypothetical protein